MPDWDVLFRQDEYRWKQPHERVVEFASLYPDPAGVKILDLGCGSGRHLVYLARQGFSVYGLDSSATGLGYAQKWLEAEGLSAELVQQDMTCLPYPDEYFDGLISIHVIFHNTLANMRKTIREIHRVLCPGGWALVTFQSKRNYRYRRGQEIEPDTFIPDIGADQGVPHHYSDLSEFDRECSQFIIRRAQLSEHLDDEALSSHWEVWLQKPEK